MALARSDRDEVKRAIAAHLLHDDGTWHDVKRRFPGVPVATFWRWVREAKQRPSAEQIEAARQLLVKTPGAAVPDHFPLPAPVPASALIEGGTRVIEKMNFFREFDELMSDAKLLRSFSLAKDGAAVRIPKVFVESAKLRIQLMRMWVEAFPILYSAEQVQEFYAVAVAEIGKCSPEAQRNILASLRAIRDRAGFAATEAEPS